MASVVDICNLGLGHIGDEANVSSLTPPDGSVQADHCKRFYPIARDVLLESHNWSFATQRETLALLEVDELPAEWAYAYAYPSCLKVLAVYPPGIDAIAPSNAIFNPEEFLTRVKPYAFTIETLDDGSRVIYSNVEDATVYFIRFITDTTLFTPMFVDALARLLASYLAGPVLKGKAGMEVARAQREIYEKIEGPRARASDSRSGHNPAYKEFVPASISARR